MNANSDHITVDSMDSHKSHLALALGWLLGAAAFLAQHWNAVLSTAGLVVAIVASAYSALSSRAKKKFYEAELRKLNETGKIIHPPE